LRSLLIRLFRRGAHRIEAEVFSFNHVSLRLLENLGFQREGLKREAHHHSGQYFDIHVLGLLKSDLRRRSSRRSRRAANISSK
jgi:ribosomal-protein-alanine N-acetyltransferase